MTITEILETLKQRGVTLSTQDGEKLHVSAPAGAITGDLRRIVSERKREILIVLTTIVPCYTLEELLATGTSTLGCIHGARHHEAWVWRDERHRYVCQACAPLWQEDEVMAV